MVEQSMKAHECACPAGCKLVLPVLMIVVGIIALVRELSGKVPGKQEARNG